MVDKIPPPPPLAQKDQALNRWLIELTGILNGTGEIIAQAVTQPPGTNTTDVATCAFVLANVGSAVPSNNNPLSDGVAAPGVSGLYSRYDHVHPSDTSRAPLASPAFTGSPTAPTQTASDNSTKLATTAFVQSNLGNFAPVVSPNFTGIPTAPTPATADNSTKIATTAFVQANLGGIAPLNSPAFTGAPTAPTQSSGDNSTKIATTAFVGGAITNAINTFNSTFNKVLSGSGPPATGLGNIQDWYADYTNAKIYVKTASAVWTPVSSS